jgi:cation transport ATPase
MKIFRILIVFAFCSFAVLSNNNNLFAQESTEVVTEEIWEQVDQSDSLVEDSSLVSDKAQSEVEKKKKKEKDIIKLNGTFFINLLINVCSVLFIIFLIYYPRNKKLSYIFTFILFNIVIFMLTYVLNEVKISMGAAFGLFAVFSMLRYRTAGISMKDMTYLFVFIALGLISAIRLDYWELGVINGILIVAIFLLDSNWLFKKETTRSIEYDNLELIKPDNREALIEDLKSRTGFNIHRVVIGNVNLLRDSATIKVYFYE